MIGFNSSVKLTKDSLNDLVSRVEALAGVRVLVGIPGDDKRKNPKEPPNHVLGYIHEFGVPTRGIPARPFLIPGVADAQGKIKAIAYAAGLQITNLATKTDARIIAAQTANKMGLVAQSAVRRRIVDGPFTPLKPATIAARARAQIAIDWAGMKNWRKANPGIPVNMVRWVSTKPLNATGQLRASISYVLENR